jgi:hypothetical protein
VRILYTEFHPVESAASLRYALEQNPSNSAHWTIVKGVIFLRKMTLDGRAVGYIYSDSAVTVSVRPTIPLHSTKIGLVHEAHTAPRTTPACRVSNCSAIASAKWDTALAWTGCASGMKFPGAAASALQGPHCGSRLRCKAREI